MFVVKSIHIQINIQVMDLSIGFDAIQFEKQVCFSNILYIGVSIITDYRRLPL